MTRKDFPTRLARALRREVELERMRQRVKLVPTYHTTYVKGIRVDIYTGHITVPTREGLCGGAFAPSLR